MANSLDPVLILGAGLSGLLAARALREHGQEVILLEAADEVGGRLATRVLGSGRYDSGAQFFTVREARFQRLVDEWLAAGVVALWSDGFPGASGRPRRDGHPRYRGAPGMAAIAHYLAADLNVRLGKEIVSAAVVDGRWRLRDQGGGTVDGRALILTAPLPQSLETVAAGDYTLPADVQTQLAAIRYAPCLALLVELAAESRVPPPGGLQMHGEPIAFIGDNRQKGVSPLAHALTIHAGPQFSRDHWRTADAVVAALLLDEAAYWLGAAAKQWRVERWRYSIPEDIITSRCLSLSGPPPLIFAGDVFGGPRVEGAALSGLAAAQLLVDSACTSS